MPTNNQDRRKRMSPPRSLTILGVVMLVFPFVNYFVMAVQTRQALLDPSFLFHWHKAPVLLLLVFSVVAGFGLVRGKKWGWWAFMSFAILSIVYNTALLLFSSSLYNVTALLRLVLFIGLVLYFVRRDISAPYFKMYPRGWRLQKRRPVSLPVDIGGQQIETTDFSSSGLYVRTDALTPELNEELPVRFSISGRDFEIAAGVTRIDDDGLGLAFRGLAKKDKRELDRLIAKLS